MAAARPLLLYQTLPLECPFAWATESYTLTKEIKFVPSGMNLPISFTATKTSKMIGYIPIIGTGAGIYKIFKGVQEYQHFKNTHLHNMSNRSRKWVLRGVLECIPVLGGLLCIIIDIAATILNKSIGGSSVKALEDETDCGFCHQCGFCKC